MTISAKNPALARAGAAGAAARWGEQRVLRLDKLTPEQRRLVKALLEATAPPPAAADEAGAPHERA